MKTSTLRNAISIALLMAATGTGGWAMAQDTTKDTAAQDRAAMSKTPTKAQSEKDTDKSATPVATSLQTVTVTGTRIRGGTTPSPVITIGSEQIQQEGFADLGEVIRSVPQNFSGGQNPGVAAGARLGAGGLANQNITGGSSLNLRGLGPDATLTLLNGRRMAYGGFVQAVDIGAIPVDAVERIEIVADGASAIYGSDAVGGVGNIILKRDYEGVTIGARYGDTADGGLASRDYTATAGATWSSGGLITTYKDSSVDPIYAGRRDYTHYLRDPTTIYPGSDLHSALLSAHQSFGDTVEVRMDALQSKRKQLYYAWPSGKANYYSRFTPETKATLVSPTVEIDLPGNWSLWAGATWGRDERVQYESRVFVDAAPTLQTNDCYCNESRAYEIGAEGPLFTIRGRDARIAVGAGYRINDFLHANYLGGKIVTEGDEASRFAYAEVNLPLLGVAENITGARRLELTAALRSEDYDSFGSVTTPKLGLIYGPSPDFTLKASWGRSFKAPTLFQRYWARQSVLYAAATLGGADYPAGSTALLVGGGNPDLDAERAQTWTATLAFHPVALSSLGVELSWFDINYTGRVVQPITDYAHALSDPAYAQFLEYFPAIQRQQDLIAATDRFVNASGAPYDPNDVVALIYAPYINVTRQKIRGLDLSGTYWFDFAGGRLALRGSGSWLDSSQQSAAALGTYALSGTLYNPAKISTRTGVIWTRGAFSASTFVNYTGGVTITTTDERSSSFTTFDATLRYSTDERENVWSGLEFVLSAQNLFNRAPPLITTTSNTYVPYDSTNYSAIGRFVNFSVSKHFGGDR